MLDVLKLTPHKLQEQVQTIVSFLRAVHPFLDKPNQYECIEIRPISRSGYEYNLAKPLNLWNLNEKSIERLKEFLKLHNGKPYCLYFSVYTFDFDKIAYTKDGKVAQKGRITSDTAVFTQEIALDFDGFSYDEYINTVDAFEELDIYAVWTHTGHGYQAHILLDKPLMDKKALHKLVYLFRSKGFDADPSCIDAARLMRLPYTFNCKCFADDTYIEERDNPPLCELLQESISRYSYEELEQKLSQLKTVREEEYVEQLKIKTSSTTKMVDNKDVVLQKTDYPWLHRFDIPEPVCKMLAKTPHGYRNKVFGFLIRYFKSYLKLSKLQIKEILDIWSTTACSPAYDITEFETDFQRFYYRNGLNFDTSLAKQFGYIDFGNQIRLQKQDILLPTDFLKKLDELDSKAVRLYLAIKLLEHVEKETNIENLAELLKLSTRAIHPTLQDLIKNKFIYVIKGNQTRKIPNQYVVSKIVSSLSEGYLKISYNDAKAYITELGKGEIKLYLFMLYKFYSGDCFMSQTHLGEFIGLSQNRVSEITTKLAEKDFLSIEHVPITDKVYFCRYTLLR